MGFIDGYLKSPFSVIVPWVLVSVLSGPGRFEVAASAALGLMLLTLWAGSRRGIRVHLLETFGAAFFGVLGDPRVARSRQRDRVARGVGRRALQHRAGVVRDRYPVDPKAVHDGLREGHHARGVLGYAAVQEVNDAISATWAFSFTVSAISGAISNTVMRAADDFWTSWILPLAATFFTEFYPDDATAKFSQEVGEPTDPPDSILRVLD